MTTVVLNYPGIEMRPCKMYITLFTIKAMANKYFQGAQMMLTHYQTTNFRLFQTERVCRRQFQI